MRGGAGAGLPGRMRTAVRPAGAGSSGKRSAESADAAATGSARWPCLELSPAVGPAAEEEE